MRRSVRAPAYRQHRNVTQRRPIGAVHRSKPSINLNDRRAYPAACPNHSFRSTSPTFASPKTPSRPRPAIKAFSDVKPTDITSKIAVKSPTSSKQTPHVLNKATTDKVGAIYKVLAATQPTFVEQEDSEWQTRGLSNTPFKHLVSCALSTMTTNQRTIKASIALFAEVNTFDELRNIPEERLVELIKPVAHYNRKAKNLQKMSTMIIEEFNNTVPQTKEELLRLPGIGQKCSNLVMTYVYNEPIIAVDTHVHRVVNRLGIVHAKSPEKTADQLNEITPDDLKKHAHEWLIHLGMNICKPRKPRCDECPVAAQCDFFRQNADIPH